MLMTIPKALIAFGFVWLMVPHQPDLGLGRPKAIETLITNSAANGCGATCDRAAVIDSIATMENSHNVLMDNIARVRSDLRANGVHLGALSRNGAL